MPVSLLSLEMSLPTPGLLSLFLQLLCPGWLWLFILPYRLPLPAMTAPVCHYQTDFTQQNLDFCSKHYPSSTHLGILKCLSEDLELVLSPTKRFCSCCNPLPSLISAQLLYAKASSSNMWQFTDKWQDWCGVIWCRIHYLRLSIMNDNLGYYSRSIYRNACMCLTSCRCLVYILKQCMSRGTLAEKHLCSCILSTRYHFWLK